MAIFAAFIPPGELHPPQRASCCSSEALLGRGALQMLLISHTSSDAGAALGYRGLGGTGTDTKPHSHTEARLARGQWDPQSGVKWGSSRSVTAAGEAAPSCKHCLPPSY